MFDRSSYSKNLRKEITKSSKWYFQDIGIRNAIINDFRPFGERPDTEQGALWENFIVSERMKMKLNNMANRNMYFWRTYDQQEIDLIEEENTRLTAFEMKAGKKSPKVPKAFADAYPDATYHVVSKDNFMDFVK